jgi:hypothetical protein
MPDIRLARGDTFVFDVYATRADEAVDLTNAKAWFTMKRNRRDADSAALIQHDSSDASTQVRIIQPLLGIVRVKIVPADTSALAPSYYPYDVQVKEADNTVSTIERGFVELDRDTTISVA